MNYSIFLVELSKALSTQNGHRLAYLLSATGQGALELSQGLTETGRFAFMKYRGAIKAPWDDVGIAHVQTILRYGEGKMLEAYTEQANMVKAFLRALIDLQSWILPTLFTILKDLRDLAEKADDSQFQQGKTSASLEEAARLCNRAFTDCVMDRSTGLESRKWGIYHVVGLIFKCYFSVNKIALTRNIIRALSAHKDIPPLEQYPRADQVTYHYYLGKLSFLNEQYADAERELTFAFDLCTYDSVKNLELMLNYLIPLRILRGQLPSEGLLAIFPRLKELYGPFIKALRAGDVKAFDAALDWAEMRLGEMGVYLAVEKAREICMRGLFRRVWLILGQPSRIQISQFQSAFEISGMSMPMEEAECIVANMIFKGYMKGYISHERQTVVLAKGAAAFPKLSDRKV